MEVLKEITVWPDNTPNHTYYINSAGKMVSFINSVTGEKTTFKKPLSFDRRYRKFITVDKYADDIDKTAKVVHGSKGAVYYVKDGKCTCPGFKFRGTCKHV